MLIATEKGCMETNPWEIADQEIDRCYLEGAKAMIHYWKYRDRKPLRDWYRRWKRFLKILHDEEVDFGAKDDV